MKIQELWPVDLSHALYWSSDYGERSAQTCKRVHYCMLMGMRAAAVRLQTDAAYYSSQQRHYLMLLLGVPA